VVARAALPPAPAPSDVAPVAAPPAEDALPTLAILSPGERAALPALKLSMHVWNETPAKRFAIVDGQRIVEGAQLGGAVVTQIRRDGVELDVNGRRVLLPRP
jgi:general secretion pathway protein B